jgi:hypothetical protein
MNQQQQYNNPINSNDYNHVFSELQDYTITNNFIKEIETKIINNKDIIDPSQQNTIVMPKSVKVPMPAPVPEKQEKQENQENQENQEKQKNVFDLDLYYPRQKDKLFWCYFILKNGFSKYEYPGATSFESEKEEKFKSIEIMRKEKQNLKTNKIKNIKEHVEDELMNKERIGMKTFIALCIGSGINVLFIHKRKCFDLVTNVASDSKIHIVICEDNLKCPSKYGFEMDISPEKANYYRENYFKWESVDKPLKAISYYKSEELLVLCKKLGLDFGNTQKTKKDMYELLIMNL